MIRAYGRRRKSGRVKCIITIKNWGSRTPSGKVLLKKQAVHLVPMVVAVTQDGGETVNEKTISAVSG